VKIAVTGSTGLIGTAVTARLRSDGHQVIRLVRRQPDREDEVAWSPGTAAGGIAPAALDGVTAVIHLAGAPIAGRRWTQAYKAKIADSRSQGTRALVTALTAMATPPQVLLSGSAIGYYGDTGGRAVDESSPSGHGFLPQLVRDWEAAAEPATQAGIRVITLRTGVVLSPRGGMLQRLVPLFKLGGGARLGPGTQVMSWISLSDLTDVVTFLLARDQISGPVNATSPSPVTNAEFTAALADALHRPALLVVPTPVLRLAVGGVSSDLLSSARVMPRRLLAAGFAHRYPTVRAALAAELGLTPR
jgi:hypothetical protein